MSGPTLDMRNVEKIGNGKTPDDIEEKCLKLCQDYLGGQWLKQTKDTISVRRLTGGMLNQLYYCGIDDTNSKTINGTINETTDEDRDVPKEVAIKLTQKKPFPPPDAPDMKKDMEGEHKNRQLSEIVVSLMVSENGLGPKIYGMFDGGVIFKYYEQEPFTVSYQSNEVIVREVLQKLARLHSLDPPIQRKTRMMFSRMLEDNFNRAVEKGFIDDMVNSDYESFKNHDFNEEYKWINDLMKKTKMPLVLTHNDYRSDNIMILKDGPDGNRIVICDFEFPDFGYRAMDFMHILKEWGNENAFFDRENLYYPPEDSVLDRLLQYYCDESVRIFGQQWAENPVNSVEHLKIEIKVLWLYLALPSALPMMKFLDEDHKVPEDMLRFMGGKRPDKPQLMKMAHRGFDNYLKLKNKLIKDVTTD